MVAENAECIHECRAKLLSTIDADLMKIIAVANTGTTSERIQNAKKGGLIPPVQEAFENVRNIINDSTYGHAVTQDTILLQKIAARVNT